MGDTDEKTPLSKLRLEISGARERVPDDDEEDASGVRERPESLTNAMSAAVRAALELACAAGERIRVVLRGDPARGLPLRTIEGIVAEINVAPDGRARVVIDVAEGCSQIVLVDRVVRVSSAT